jgi:large subunit ribosomal protein L10
MDNPRPEKVAVVDEVRQRLGDADAAILTEYRGLTVKDIATLRRSLRDVGSEYKIYKNTLVRLAAKGAGLDELEPLLEGPTAIAFVTGDAAAVAKALRDFSRTNPHLVLKGGVLGKRIITEKDTAALAELPSREVLLARFAGGLAAPLQQFAGLLQALPRNFAYGLKALIEKQGGDAAVAAASGPAPEAAAEAAPEPVADLAPELVVEADIAPAAAAPEAEVAPSEDLAPVEEAVVEPAPEPEITESQEAPAATTETEGE